MQKRTVDVGDVIDSARFFPAPVGIAISPVDPEIWQLVEGRLVLQHTQQAYDLFNADLAANVAKADANWPGLVARNGVRAGETGFARLLRWIGIS